MAITMATIAPVFIRLWFVHVSLRQVTIFTEQKKLRFIRDPYGYIQFSRWEK